MSRVTGKVAGIVFAMAFAAMAQSTDDVRLELVLKDNSRLRGRPVRKAIKVKTEILSTPVELVLAKVSHIEHKHDKTGFLVTFINDDTISCKILQPGIELVTLLGKFTVPFDKIRAIRNVSASKGKWTAVPNPPPSRSSGYREQKDIACDKDDTVWVAGFHGVSKIHKRKSRFIGFRTGFNLTMLFGTPNRGLYITQFDTSRNKGLLHRLTDNRSSKPLTEYRLNSIYQVPCLHVAATRKIYNWGESFVRVFALRPGSGQANGEWKEWEAQLTRKATRLLEIDGDMHFFCNNQVWIADKNDNFSTNRVSLTTKVMKARKGKKRPHPPLVLARWDTNHIISFSPGDSAIQANTLDTFKPVDAGLSNKYLAAYKLHRAFGSRDGSALLSAFRQRDGVNLLLRLTRDGTVIPLEETNRLLGGNVGAISGVHQDSEGAFWLAAGRRGLARYRKRNLTVFGPDDGIAYGCYFQITAAPDGKIWTLSRRSPYVFETTL